MSRVAPAIRVFKHTSTKEGSEDHFHGAGEVVECQSRFCGRKKGGNI